MNYDEMLAFIIKERQQIDTVVEDIVRLNGEGSLFRVDTPAVNIKEIQNGYSLSNDSKCLFTAEPQM